MSLRLCVLVILIDMASGDITILHFVPEICECQDSAVKCQVLLVG